MILLIVLGVLAALAAVPLKLALAYDQGNFRAAVRVGPVTVFRYPAKKKPESERPSAKEENGPAGEEEKPSHKAGASEEKSAGKEPAPAQTGEQGEQSQDGLKKWMPFVRLAWELLGDLRRKLVVDRLVFRLMMADPDPCDLAVNYGRVLALKESLLPMLERVLEIRSREIDIRCDFAAEKTELTARADLVLTLGRAAVLAAVYGVRALKEYWNLKNKPKGGA